MGKWDFPVRQILHGAGWFHGEASWGMCHPGPQDFTVTRSLEEQRSESKK